MKKANLKVGLLVLGFVSLISIQQTVSAISLKQGFDIGKISKDTSSQEGQVLAANTEDSSEHTQNQASENKEEVVQPQETIVEVVKGDSLDKIAKANNTTYKRIFDANESIKDPNVINPGEKFRIPKPEEELVSREIPVAVAPQPAKAVSNNSKKQPAKPAKAPPTPAPAVANGSVWDSLAKCESGGNWSINTGNGYYGGLQFSAATWRAVGGTGLPHQHSREEQIKRAEMLLARSGWGQWPACTKKLGLR